MHSTYRRLAAAAVAAAVLGSTASAAAADPSATTTPARQKDGRSAAAIARYWTPKRMRNARPMPIPGVTAHAARVSGHRNPGGKTVSAGGTRSRVPLRKPGSLTRRPGGGPLAHTSMTGLPELPWKISSYGESTPNSAVGRIFFRGWDRNTSSWYDSSCTGTLVSANLVLTAAHCVREGRPDGVSYQSFTFVPGLNGTSRPYGTFSSRNQVTATSWFSAPYYNSAGTGGGGFYGQDYAFVVLNRDSLGRNAGDVAGAYSFYMNAPSANASVIHMGYPSEGGWNGCSPLSCKP